MSKLKEKLFQTVVLVGLALTVGCAPEAFARSVGHSGGGGGGGHGHVSSGHSYGGGGHYYHNGGGGYYNNYGWGNGGNYGTSYGGQGYYPPAGPPGQVFSGPAHIDPSQYNNYVQTYQWPSHQ